MSITQKNFLIEYELLKKLSKSMSKKKSKSKSYPDPCGPIGPALISGFNGLEPVGDRVSMPRTRGWCVAEPTVCPPARRPVPIFLLASFRTVRLTESPGSAIAQFP